MIPPTNKNFLVISSQDIRTVRISEESHWNMPLFYLKADSHLTHIYTVQWWHYLSSPHLTSSLISYHSRAQRNEPAEAILHYKSYWDFVWSAITMSLPTTIMKSNITGCNYNLFVPSSYSHPNYHLKKPTHKQPPHHILLHSWKTGHSSKVWCFRKEIQL